ncbi:MAG: hypothetical protein RL376_1836, partial [Verrucomicrobiota bacterium]
MQTETHHILIAEDTPAIQDDYRRILSAEDEWASSVPGAAKFAPELVDSTPPPCPLYELTCVAQGEEALSAAERATTNGKPFSLAFIDVRMPPGVDGVQTALELRRRHPDLQIVLCTAYSDYSWQDIIRNFPESDGVLLLKKPFDPAEVRQLAYNLAQKRRLSTENHQLINNLERLITARTMQLVQKSQELATALSAAQKADRAKHDFLRCVSHELNTPLNGVHGAASVLSFSTDRQAQAMGQIITDSSNRLKRLFTRILLYLDLEPVTTPTPSPLRTGTALAA